jgi:hypothetical protein
MRSKSKIDYDEKTKLAPFKTSANYNEGDPYLGFDIRSVPKKS